MKVFQHEPSSVSTSCCKYSLQSSFLEVWSWNDVPCEGLGHTFNVSVLAGMQRKAFSIRQSNIFSTLSACTWPNFHVHLQCHPWVWTCTHGRKLQQPVFTWQVALQVQMALLPSCCSFLFQFPGLHLSFMFWKVNQVIQIIWEGSPPKSTKV